MEKRRQSKSKHSLLKKVLIGGIIAGAAFAAPFRGDFSPRKIHAPQSYSVAEKVVAAHRGGTKRYHENSLESFKYLGNTGAELAELDVRSTKDALVVFHDRTIGGKRLSSLTYEQASKLAKKEGYTLPRLDSAFKEIKEANAGVIIDLKERGHEDEIINAAKRYFPINDIIISSENTTTLRRIKDINPNIKTTLIVPKEYHFLGRVAREASGTVPWRGLKQSKADYVAVHGGRVNPRFYKNASKGDVGVFVYGLSSPGEIKDALSREQVKGVIVDSPAQASKIKEKMTNHHTTHNVARGTITQKH